MRSHGRRPLCLRFVESPTERQPGKQQQGDQAGVKSGTGEHIRVEEATDEQSRPGPKCGRSETALFGGKIGKCVLLAQKAEEREGEQQEGHRPEDTVIAQKV